MVVDDFSMMRDLVATILQGAGHAVVTAANGREAVDLWEAKRFDVIFMDCEMPEMDGYRATGAIREREDEEQAGRAPVYIVAMTANAMREDRARCLEAGMDDFLSKPVRRVDIERALAAQRTSRADLARPVQSTTMTIVEVSETDASSPPTDSPAAVEEGLVLSSLPLSASTKRKGRSKRRKGKEAE